MKSRIINGTNIYRPDGSLICFYTELGLTPEASNVDIKKAYNSLVMKYHPDKGGNNEMFNRITTAYQILTNSPYLEEYKICREEARVEEQVKAIRIANIKSQIAAWIKEETDKIKARARAEIAGIYAHANAWAQQEISRTTGQSETKQQPSETSHTYSSASFTFSHPTSNTKKPRSKPLKLSQLVQQMEIINNTEKSPEIAAQKRYQLLLKMAEKLRKKTAFYHSLKNNPSSEEINTVWSLLQYPIREKNEFGELIRSEKIFDGLMRTLLETLKWNNIEVKNEGLTKPKMSPLWCAMVNGSQTFIYEMFSLTRCSPDDQIGNEGTIRDKFFDADGNKKAIDPDFIKRYQLTQPYIAAITNCASIQPPSKAAQPEEQSSSSSQYRFFSSQKNKQNPSEFSSGYTQPSEKKMKH